MSRRVTFGFLIVFAFLPLSFAACPRTLAASAAESAITVSGNRHIDAAMIRSHFHAEMINSNRPWIPGTSMFWMTSSGEYFEKSRPKWPEVHAIAPPGGIQALMRSIEFLWWCPGVG
jgi:hypothetical protein